MLMLCRYFRVTLPFRYTELITEFRLWMFIIVMATWTSFYNFSPAILGLLNDTTTRLEFHCEFFNMFPRWYLIGLTLNNIIPMPLVGKNDFPGE